MLEEQIRIDAEDCIGCNLCIEVCPTTPCVFEMRDITAVVVYPDVCERCRLCTDSCPTNAIKISREEDVLGGNA